ncbi:tRNA (adenosine(37)-N6)-threonylcarbamoyltransferase complex ATPase subunit type 1 TsaE [Pedobacter frigoris]|uniref:tRNA threonylcarbamoyladenosine biosynthesis protein TsaE n=1 Tax=Pedobacter frigoris TaxID=2571272 RepID=A0A4U1CGH9_9SPHI|nr:tRNA (adenosine(37)-N6)-threonylcarbamoyltransferase complex ATPase subunit type 1 TsaE [Pedobacter frigoris]TKC04952.1 tRNA (adenosine(37)-N6)-threonylcarbamoyltransferase complex ATPase subunit type 1 TsaE [Pedobacter frigoris]
MKIKVNRLSDLDEAAQSLLSFAGDNKFFIFEGDMGAGKTTFIKAIAAALGVLDTVSSPTFSIVNEYVAGEDVIYHFDFYRIKSIQEAYDIGYEEYFYSGHTCFIEWPEKIQELLPESYIKVEIFTVNENERMLSVSKI